MPIGPLLAPRSPSVNALLQVGSDRQETDIHFLLLISKLRHHANKTLDSVQWRMPARARRRHSKIDFGSIPA